MPTIRTIKTYSLEELKSFHPEGYARAVEAEKQRRSDLPTPWADETCNSLKALFVAIDHPLTNWSLGAYNPSFIRFDMDDAIRGLSGPRAIAWFENNLFGQYRIPWTSPKRCKFGSMTRYSLDSIKPCPLTGYYFDEDLFRAIRQSVRNGVSVGSTLNGLVTLTQSSLEQEQDAYLSEDLIAEDLSYNGCEYTRVGERYTHDMEDVPPFDID